MVSMMIVWWWICCEMGSSHQFTISKVNFVLKLIPSPNIKHTLWNHGLVGNFHIIGTMQLGCLILGRWGYYHGWLKGNQMPQKYFRYGNIGNTHNMGNLGNISEHCNSGNEKLISNLSKHCRKHDIIFSQAPMGCDLQIRHPEISLEFKPTFPHSKLPHIGEETYIDYLQQHS